MVFLSRLCCVGMKAIQKTTSPQKNTASPMEPLTVSVTASASVSTGQIHSVHL